VASVTPTIAIYDGVVDFLVPTLFGFEERRKVMDWKSRAQTDIRH